MQYDHRFFLTKFFQIGAVESQGQTIEQVHDEVDHDRVTFQAQFDEISDAAWVGDRLCCGIEFTVTDLNVDVRVGDDILEPVRICSTS